MAFGWAWVGWGRGWGCGFGVGRGMGTVCTDASVSLGTYLQAARVQPLRLCIVLPLVLLHVGEEMQRVRDLMVLVAVHLLPDRHPPTQKPLTLIYLVSIASRRQLHRPAILGYGSRMVKNDRRRDAQPRWVRKRLAAKVGEQPRWVRKRLAARVGEEKTCSQDG